MLYPDISPPCWQTCPSRSCFLSKPRGDHISLDKAHKPVQTDPWRATWATQTQPDVGAVRGSLVVKSLRRGDELQSLCKQGWLQRESDVFACLDQPGNPASVHAHRSLSQACSERKALFQARRVPAQLAKSGPESHRSPEEHVVNMLAKSGSLDDALQVFNRLPCRTVFSWAALIAGHVRLGQSKEALSMYQQMLKEGVQPNAYTFLSVLRACGDLLDLEQGRHIHGEAVKYGCESDACVSTCLINMYGKCGSIGDAQNVFDVLVDRDVVSWTAILSAYVKQGEVGKALQLYDQMLEEGVAPDHRTFVSVLQACCVVAGKELNRSMGGHSLVSEILAKGKTIHSFAYHMGYDSDVFVGNTLLSFYGKCGAIADAQCVFDALQCRDVVSWNAIISAYCNAGHAEKAWHLYERMGDEGISPDVRTFVSALQACGMLAEEEDCPHVNMGSIKTLSLHRGKIMHMDARRKGYDSDVFLGNTLVAMYGKCRSIADAQNVFNWLSQRTVVSWTAMLSAYLLEGQAEKSLEVYIRMQKEENPNDRTYAIVFQACGILAEKEEAKAMDGEAIRLKYLDLGKSIHADALYNGYISDDFVRSTLITMYGKCGSTSDARNVFDGCPKQSLVSWTAMLTAYVEQGDGENALRLYTQMQLQGVSPDEITLICVLQACSNTGNLDLCAYVHQTLRCKATALSSLLANNLIHAYGRCASMVDAQTLFDSLVLPDVVSWNALLSGYSRQGNFFATFEYYEKMRLVGIRPDGVTFLSLLSACSHAGLVGKGVEYFESMRTDHGLDPHIEHYASMVDLLGRAGYFREVEDLLVKIPLQPNLSMWLSLLAACRKHGNVVLGKKAFDCAVSQAPNHAAAYALMWNIYVDAGLWDSANHLNELRTKVCARDKPGQSWLRHGRNLYNFGAGHSRDLSKNQLLLETVLGVNAAVGQSLRPELCEIPASAARIGV